MAEPYCLAMVLCDGVHRDAATGKFTLLGTFSTLGAAEFPAEVLFCVYFAVTDGLGETQVSLRIVDAESSITGDGDAVWQSPAALQLNFEVPLMVMESVAIVQTQLPKPGLYYCELTAGGQLLMSRRILAVDGNEEQKHDE